MRDQYINNCLVVYIKKDVADNIDIETINVNIFKFYYY